MARRAGLAPFLLHATIRRMADSEAIDLLRQIPFLRDLDQAELARVAETLIRRPFPANTELFRQGSLPDGLYLLQRGEVELLVAHGSKPSPRRAARFVPGDYFGEAELLVRQPRAGTARALTQGVAHVWPRARLLPFLRNHPTALAGFRLAVSTRQKSLRLNWPWLEEGETVYGLTNRHAIVICRGLALPAFALLASAGLAGLALSGAGMVSTWIAIGFALAGLALVLWQWVDWRNDFCVITDRRAVRLEKVVGLYDSRQEAPLSMVLSVAVTTSFLGRLLDYGDVVVRTYTGQVVFHTVPHPRAIAALIEEHWRRSRLRAQRTDRESIRQALQQGLKQASGIDAPAADLPPPPEQAPRTIGLDRWTLQLRFEEQGVITYRRHWAVLLRSTLLPSLLVLVLVGLIGAALGGVLGTASAGTILFLTFLLLPTASWWIYRYVDWANDIYQVTPDQIVAIHKKPLASEERKVAPLENILGTEVERKGLAGLFLNFGNVIANVGTTQFIFRGVHDPSGVQQDIVRALQAYLERKRQVERDQRREEMLEWLGAYHRQVHPDEPLPKNKPANHGRT